MIEFEMSNGRRILLNPDTIIAVNSSRMDEGVCCVYTMGADGEPWYIKGTLDEIASMLWAGAKRL